MVTKNSIIERLSGLNYPYFVEKKGDLDKIFKKYKEEKPDRNSIYQGQ